MIKQSTILTFEELDSVKVASPAAKPVLDNRHICKVS